MYITGGSHRSIIVWKYKVFIANRISPMPNAIKHNLLDHMKSCKMPDQNRSYHLKARLLFWYTFCLNQTRLLDIRLPFLIKTLWKPSLLVRCCRVRCQPKMIDANEDKSTNLFNFLIMYLWRTLWNSFFF